MPPELAKEIKQAYMKMGGGLGGGALLSYC